MAYMRDADDNRLDTIHIKNRLDGIEADLADEVTDRAAGDTANAASIAAIKPAAQYTLRPRYVGPVSTDNPTVTTGIAADAAFNKSYAVAGSTLPADWPVDAFGKMTAGSNVWASYTSDPTIGTVTTYRFMSDGSDVLLFLNATNSLGDLFIDGAPYASNPITFAASTGFGTFGFQKLVFSTAAPRLIELRMISQLAAVYSKNPYRLWKPPPEVNPKIAVVGDSFVYPLTCNNTTSGYVTAGPWLQGAYQRILPYLGSSALVTDGVGGTGYIADSGGTAKNYAHATRVAWLQTVNPDVIIVHGGGVNDRFYGSTNAQVITAATNYFTTLRTNHPNARLVFVEGFRPPGFQAYYTDADLTAIRSGVQANLAAAGIKNVYYIDVATTRQPIFGTGYATATNGTGNSDIYIGFDSFHPTVRGHEFIRRFLSPKIQTVLADTGALAGTLVT